MGKRVLKQGPLQRLEGRVFAWKKRWFVLDAEELSCYASEKAYQANDAALACVTVADCVAEAGGEREEPGSFVVRFGQGQLVLRAGTSEQALEWVDLLGRQRASKETKSATMTRRALQPSPTRCLLEDSEPALGLGDETERARDSRLASRGPWTRPRPTNSTKSARLATPLDSLVLELFGVCPGGADVGPEASLRTEDCVRRVCRERARDHRRPRCRGRTVQRRVRES